MHGKFLILPITSPIPHGSGLLPRSKVAKKRTLLHVVCVIMRIACASPPACGTLGDLGVHTKLRDVIQKCRGGRDLELIEASVSALWFLSFSAKNRSLASTAQIPELIVSLLQLADDTRLVFLKTQAVADIWQLALQPDVKQSMLALQPSAALVRVLYSESASDPRFHQLCSTTMWLLLSFLCSDDDAHLVQLRSSHGPNIVLEICLFAARPEREKPVRVAGFWGLEKLTVRLRL